MNLGSLSLKHCLRIELTNTERLLASSSSGELQTTQFLEKTKELRGDEVGVPQRAVTGFSIPLPNYSSLLHLLPISTSSKHVFLLCEGLLRADVDMRSDEVVAPHSSPSFIASLLAVLTLM